MKEGGRGGVRSSSALFTFAGVAFTEPCFLASFLPPFDPVHVPLTPLKYSHYGRFNTRATYCWFGQSPGTSHDGRSACHHHVDRPPTTNRFTNIGFPTCHFERDAITSLYERQCRSINQSRSLCSHSRLSILCVCIYMH